MSILVLDIRSHPFLSKAKGMGFKCSLVLQPQGDCIHNNLLHNLVYSLYFYFSCPPNCYILLAILVQALQGYAVHQFLMKLGDSLGLVLNFQALLGFNCAWPSFPANCMLIFKAWRYGIQVLEHSLMSLHPTHTSWWSCLIQQSVSTRNL